MRLPSAVSELGEKNGLSRILDRIRYRKSSGLWFISTSITQLGYQNNSFANSPEMISAGFAVIVTRLDQGIQQERLNLRLANAGPWAKSSPLLTVVNAVLLEPTVIPICFHIVCGCFCTSNAELSRCSRDHMAHKIKNIYSLALYRKSFLIFVLDY